MLYSHLNNRPRDGFLQILFRFNLAELATKLTGHSKISRSGSIQKPGFLCKRNPLLEISSDISLFIFLLDTWLLFLGEFLSLFANMLSPILTVPNLLLPTGF
ncbi:MAG: hypothetical protein CL609_00960 [Anaerolineaceae bacterium]|nr:hypothetical protein [Anaerolineaceae bacterium]